MSRQKIKIACCSTPQFGHINPIMSLVEGLVCRSGNCNNVRVFTICDGVDKVKNKCDTLGVQLVEMDIGTNMASIIKENKNKLPFLVLAQKSKALLAAALSSYDPDIIVADFTDLAAQEYATERGITLVINWPGPISMLKEFMRPVAIDDGCAFGGLYVSQVKPSVISLAFVANFGDLRTMGDRLRPSVSRALVLVNSFWGLEKPTFLPPNVVPVGPIMPSLPIPAFSVSHPELHDFLFKARQNHHKILLVTTGSMVQMDRWLVELLFQSFALLQDSSIVWSLKQPQQEFVDTSDPRFHFSSWLPQSMLLASDLVDGVVTHCGWGGTLECIAGGKPVAVLPFFGDQMDNARLLLAAGCATSVAPLPSFNVDDTGQSSYTKQDMSVQRVASGCHELLTNSRYAIAAQRLQALACAPGMGCAAACDRIEHAARHGIQHLCNTERDMYLSGHRPFVVTLCGIVVAAAIVSIAVLTILRPPDSTGEL